MGKTSKLRARSRSYDYDKEEDAAFREAINAVNAELSSSVGDNSEHATENIDVCTQQPEKSRKRKADPKGEQDKKERSSRRRSSKRRRERSPSISSVSCDESVEEEEKDASGSESVESDASHDDLVSKAIEAVLATEEYAHLRELMGDDDAEVDEGEEEEEEGSDDSGSSECSKSSSSSRSSGSSSSSSSTSSTASESACYEPPKSPQCTQAPAESAAKSKRAPKRRRVQVTIEDDDHLDEPNAASSNK